MTESLATDRARLLGLLKARAYERRAVTLSSGKTSDFYIDCKKVALLAEGHFLIGRLFLAKILELAPQVEGVGGMTLGADPLASAVSFSSFLAGRPIPAFIVRKEPKAHGTQAYIEGRANLRDGAPVAIVEDVVTTGASTLKAIERVEAEKLSVKLVLALVDREEGGRETVERRGYALHALFKRSDFTG